MFFIPVLHFLLYKNNQFVKKIIIFAPNLYNMIRRIILSAIIILLTMPGMAQFRALQNLPWYPTSSSREITTATDMPRSTNVLDQIVESFNAGKYAEVAHTLYPRAIQEGYQRNATLYNNTRRALRQLMREDATDDSWQRMQQLYRDRFKNLGTEEYEYRNSLETATWSNEQLQNERIAALAAMPDRYQDAYQCAMQLSNQNDGRIDLAIVLQGMFAPLNRANAAHPEIASDLTEPYQHVLRQIDFASTYMEASHRKEYLAYYPQTTLEQVRNECLRVISNNQAAEQYEYQKLSREIASDYSEALSAYRNKNYSRAYQLCNQALAEHNTPELHILKSNILQTCGNSASSTADRVAFWCAAYETGRGYVSQTVLNQLLDALQTNLFMSGVAGTRHKTSSQIVITQQIWTLDQLKSHTSR